MLISSIWK